MDKFMAVTDRQEIAVLLERAGDLGVPHLFGGDESPYFAKADELRAWRASQHTSEGQDHG